VIRLVLPALTEERRKDLVKVVKSEAEQAKIAIRNVRRDAMQEVKEALKKKLISDDVEKRAEQEIQKLTDQHIANVDAVAAAKEKETMSL
jgi:ribosome recycling factor